MGRARIGELIGKMVPLSAQDVEEILLEQKSSRRRFGDIAISWGLCEPEHVWRAWCGQTGDHLERVELGLVGIDTQSLGFMTREMAIRHCAIPVRSFDHLLVIAITDPAQQGPLSAALAGCQREVKFVLASTLEIEWAIERYYPAMAASA